MAESKRNSAAPKIATPKTAAPPTTPSAPPVVETLEALGKSIGARIKLTTAAPNAQTYEGSLFTACPTLHVVMINTRTTASATSNDAKAQPGDYHVIPISRIQSFQVLSLATAAENGANSFATAQPPIGPVDVKRLQERERAKINKLKEDEQNRGKGVTKEGQAIFDSFKRINMSIRWHGAQMIVQDAVIIDHPYTVDKCKSSSKDQGILVRVKKILEGERKKIKEKEEQDRKAAILVEPRKGG